MIQVQPVEVIEERSVKMKYAVMKVYDIKMYIDKDLVDIENGKVSFPVNGYMAKHRDFGYVIEKIGYYWTYMYKFPEDWKLYANYNHDRTQIRQIGRFVFISTHKDEKIEFQIDGVDYVFKNGVFTPASEV